METKEKAKRSAKRALNLDTLAALIALGLSFTADATGIEMSEDTILLLRMFSGAALARGMVPAVNEARAKGE